VRFAATDVKTAGQRERLETFAVHLDAAVIDASAPNLYADAAAQARRDGAFLIADTAGMDPRDPPDEILLYASMGCAEILGCVSATSDAEDAGEIAGALSRFGAERLIIIALDLARRKGALAMLATSPVALAHATSSPYLAQGLDTLTPLMLARALLLPMDAQALEA
jgi:flagellar biosynthesis protein FlhF